MKKRMIFLVISLFSLFVVSCKYDFILPEVVPPITKPVNFLADVAPIFSTGDKCTSCHKPGGQSPDLSAANAYSEINPKYVNLISPATSEILTFPGSGSHSWKGYTAGETAIILKWIEDGANNN